MSRINGEKARANIAKRNRTNRREKDRARLAALRQPPKAEGSEPAGDEKSDKQ